MTWGEGFRWAKREMALPTGQNADTCSQCYCYICDKAVFKVGVCGRQTQGPWVGSCRLGGHGKGLAREVGSFPVGCGSWFRLALRGTGVHLRAAPQVVMKLR